MGKMVNMLEAENQRSRVSWTPSSAGRSALRSSSRGDGKPAARLVPFAPARAGKRIGVAKGAFVVPDDIDASNDDVRALLTSG